jgi:hypothetical protein
VISLAQTAHILAYIDKNTFPTGSATFGCPNPQDVDRYCTAAVFEELVSMLKAAFILIEEKKVGDSESGGEHVLRSIYFGLAGIKFNVFKVAENDMVLLKVATECTTIMAKHFNTVAAKKSLRVYAFRQVCLLCELLRTYSPVVKEETPPSTYVPIPAPTPTPPDVATAPDA